MKKSKQVKKLLSENASDHTLDLQKQLEEKDSEIENTKKDADERVAQAERLKEAAETDR